MIFFLILYAYATTTPSESGLQTPLATLIAEAIVTTGPNGLSRPVCVPSAYYDRTIPLRVFALDQELRSETEINQWMRCFDGITGKPKYNEYIEKYAEYVKRAATATDNIIPTTFLACLNWHESGWDIQARSSVGALSTGQLMPTTIIDLDRTFRNPNTTDVQLAKATEVSLRDLDEETKEKVLTGHGVGAYQAELRDRLKDTWKRYHTYLTNLNPNESFKNIDPEQFCSEQKGETPLYTMVKECKKSVCKKNEIARVVKKPIDSPCGSGEYLNPAWAVGASAIKSQEVFWNLYASYFVDSAKELVSEPLTLKDGYTLPRMTELYPMVALVYNMGLNNDDTWEIIEQLQKEPDTEKWDAILERAAKNPKPNSSFGYDQLRIFRNMKKCMAKDGPLEMYETNDTVKQCQLDHPAPIPKFRPETESTHVLPAPHTTSAPTAPIPKFRPETESPNVLPAAQTTSAPTAPVPQPRPSQKRPQR